MKLAGAKEMLCRARRGGYAIGAFEIWSSESIHAILSASVECGVPVIVQASPVEYRHFGGADLMRAAVEAAAAKLGAQAALHLDHGSSYEDVVECVEAGFTSVMLDASKRPFEENAAESARAAEYARAHGVDFEAEIGHVGQTADGTEEDMLLTSPDEAARFMQIVRADFLAVAVGTVHGVYRREPNLQLDRLAEIAARVPEPLVLHGGSGTPQDRLAGAIKLGVAKINICTDLVRAYLGGIAEANETLTPSIPGKFFVPGHDAIKAKATQYIKFFAAPDKR